MENFEPSISLSIFSLSAPSQVNNRRRFNRSLTEVRPDAYIFDEGTHFEVVPVPEEPDELVKSREALNEHVGRKISMQSESDSDVYLPMSQRPSTCETVKRTPYVTVRQDTGASTESKDTLTPLGADDDHTLVGENSDETNQELNFEGKYLIKHLNTGMSFQHTVRRHRK